MPMRKKSLRKVRGWLDLEMTNKSVQEITDLISARLESYDWALRKHGIQTVTGALSQLLDLTVLKTAGVTAAGLALAGHPSFCSVASAAGIPHWKCGNSRH